MEELITTKTLAKKMKLSVSRIYDLVREDGLPCYRDSEGAPLKFRLSEVEKWLQSKRVGGNERQRVGMSE